MTEHSIRRRRAGNLLVGVAALALPLTASFSYSQPIPPEAPEAPTAPQAPLPPEAAVPPEAPSEVRQAIDLDADGDRHVYVIRDNVRARGGELRTVRDKLKVRKLRMHDEHGRIVDSDSPEYRSRMKALEKRLGNLDAEIERAMAIDEARIERAAELAEAAAEREADRAEAIAEEAAERAEAHAEARAEAALERSLHRGVRLAVAPRAAIDCDAGNAAAPVRTHDGKRVVQVCRARMAAASLAGMRAARAAIADNDAMGAETRRQVLESLDREIERLEAHD